MSIDEVPYVRIHVRRGDRVESGLPASLTGSGSYGGSLGGVKANAIGLECNGVACEENKK